MSHSATVAFRNKHGLYDIHYSHNGAEGNQLEGLLKAYVDGEATMADLRSVSSIEALEKAKKKTGSQGNVTHEWRFGDDGVEDTPLATDVKKEHLGGAVSFPDREAVYLVEDDRVETYFPAWLYPDPITPLKNNVVIEVYNSDNLEGRSMNEVNEALQNKDPLRVIDEETFSENWVEDTITRRVLRDSHENIHALIEKSYDEANRAIEAGRTDQDIDEIFKQMQLTLFEHTYLIKTQVRESFSIPHQGLGCFIKKENQTLREIELDCAEARFEVGAELPSIRREVTDDDLNEATAELLLSLYMNFGSRIAEFSPPPFGSIVQALNKTDSFVSLDLSPTIASKFNDNLMN